MQVIFNPLVQVAAKESEPHERPATSLGLGLYIAREIVSKHGGHITVSSSQEEGTAFVVQLPAQAKAPDPTNSKLESNAPPATDSCPRIEDLPADIPHR